MTKIRRISPRRPSVTVDARVPQTTAIDIDEPAANICNNYILKSVTSRKNCVATTKDLADRAAYLYSSTDYAFCQEAKWLCFG